MGDEEVLVIKNFGHGFHNKSYGYYGFPGDGTTWTEIFSSDDQKYDGMGYTNNNYGPSPYVWAGTTKYQSGKYVADGVYDAGAVDQQLGVAVMVKSLLDKKK